MIGVQLRNKIDYILEHQDQFLPDYDFISLQDKREVLDTRLTEWLNLARKCRDNIDACNPGAIKSNPAISWPEHVQVFDPLQEKWDYILTHWLPEQRYWFKEDFHPRNIYPEYTYTEIGGGKFWIFYKKYGQKNEPISGIFSHPKYGTHAVWGSIFTEYFKRGHCEGTLGYPKTDEEYVSGSDGDRINIFEKGLLWWDKQTGKVSDKSPVDIHAYINPNIVTMVNMISHPKP